ncbi:Helix-turn-helix domain-containing protein [Mesobacillus persicus]|uniref:Helix-turn-helix domain-containing protein n=1 Tax=Mesobacillus persicus TaxID=930146 RepID=A0A1H8JLA4_9BACI|nr:helix-turn-helix transcriptional regulator [Mesobacillus persicus]SEN81116.1 Helix-turn-helix domain-containing protein [Mesobacillus persicus]
MSDFGSMIRAHREQKGYTLNDFAHRIGVSPGYLSNLETGKTDTIRLHVLERLQQELDIHPLQTDEQRLEQRLQRVTLMLQQCQMRNPSLTEHFMTQFEQSLELLMDA